jgi:hypothetical protein
MSATASGNLPSERVERLRLALARVGLPAWFIVIDILWIVRPITFAIDARHYQRSASAWLTGSDPWQVREHDVLYASGPHTLLPYVPTHLVPLSAATAIWMLVGVLAAIWVVRRLQLPIWWLAFPPLFHSIWNGNPQTLMLALLVMDRPLASALAASVKLYALVQLVFRPRQLLVALAFLAITALIVPWRLYLDAGGGAAEHLAGAWNGSAWRIPVLVIPTIAGLWVLRRQGAEWWSIPAVWPATQFYYVSTVMPVVARRPVLAAFTAAPVPLMVPIVVMTLAAVQLVERRRPGWLPEVVRQVITPDGASIPAR